VPAFSPFSFPLKKPLFRIKRKFPPAPTIYASISRRHFPLTFPFTPFPSSQAFHFGIAPPQLYKKTPTSGLFKSFLPYLLRLLPLFPIRPLLICLRFLPQLSFRPIPIFPDLFPDILEPFSPFMREVPAENPLFTQPTSNQAGFFPHPGARSPCNFPLIGAFPLHYINLNSLFFFFSVPKPFDGAPFHLLDPWLFFPFLAGIGTPLSANLRLFPSPIQSNILSFSCIGKLLLHILYSFPPSLLSSRF